MWRNGPKNGQGDAQEEQAGGRGQRDPRPSANVRDGGGARRNQPVKHRDFTRVLRAQFLDGQRLLTTAWASNLLATVAVFELARKKD